MSISKRCLQGCGRFAPSGRLFCSDFCRHRYNPETWGEGRGPYSLTKILKQSVKIVKESSNGKNVSAS